MTRGFWFSSVLVLLAVVGCETLPPEAYVSGSGKTASSAAVPIGNNEVGEPCRYQTTAGGDVSTGREAVIYCGTWDQPSGRVSEIGAGADAGQVMSLVAAGPWRNYVNQRFDCGPPSGTSVAGGSAAMMQCTRRVGGWPHVAMTVAIGGRIYGADAVRPALPALQATLAAMSGQGTPAAAAAPGGSPEALRLIAERGGSAAFGSGDEGRYFDLTRRGDAYDNTDEPAKAEEAYREALAIQQKILGADNPALALTIMKLAAQVAHQQNGPDAEKLLGRAEQLIAKNNDPLLTAQLHYYRAVTLAYEGKADQAIPLAQTAETEFAKLAPEAVSRAERGSGSSGAGGLSRAGLQTLLTDESSNATQERAAISGLAESMRLRATLLQGTGKATEAAELARRTQQLLAANGLSISSTAARSLLLLANNEAVSKNYSGAVSDSSAAEKITGRVVPGQLPEARNLLAEGVFEADAHQDGAALANFRKAGAILKSPTVSGGAQPDAVLDWLNVLYGSSGDKSHIGEEMFEAAQFARNSLTAQDIAKATARLIGGDPKIADAIRSYEDSQAQYDRLQGERDQAVAAGAASDRITAIDEKIEAARKARNEAEAVVPAAAPHYLEAEEKPVTAADLRGLLSPDEAFVMFFVSDAGGYGFLLRPDGVTVYPIPLKEAEIHTMIGHLRATTIVRPGGLPTPDLDASYKLYSALFGPIEAKLAGVSKYVVSATGDLLSYPLEALVTAPDVKVGGADFRKVPFLVRKAALSYVPSPRVLVNLRHAAKAKPGMRPFIGFGDFRPASPGQLAATLPPARCHDDYEALRQLEPLPATREQVTTIAHEVGAGAGDIVLGDAFNKARLKAKDMANYRVVLLATHAFLPDTLGCFNEPAIVLSAPPGAPNADGEFLKAGEIGDLKLDADLVALSACDTSGAGGKGESLSGLARAFFRAGARGLLVTHWDVVTGASVPLMVGTFGAGAHDSAQALRAAQLRMIDSAGSSPKSPVEISHPNYWAAFVLIGDGVRGAPGA